MGRPRKPQWIDWGEGRKGYWRTKVNGEYQYEKTIPQDERPQIGGIPVRAWDWLRNLEAQSKVTQEIKAGPLTVKGLLKLYADWAMLEANAGRLSLSQAQGILSRSRSFLHHSKSGVVPAENLSVNVLADTFAGMAGKYSAHYIAGVGRTLRAGYRWGARPIAGREPIRLLAINPLEGYAFPRAPKSVREHIEGDIVRRFLRWSWGQAHREDAKRNLLKKYFDRVFVLMLRFQRITGCRPGEACDLRWDDLIWREGQKHPRAVLPAERQKTGWKTGKVRTIYLPREVIRLLRALERHPNRHPTHVFPHMRGRGAEARGHTEATQGEPWPSGSAASAKVRTMRTAAIAAGLEGIEGVGAKKLVAYANRHGYVSETRMAGGTSEQIAALLGNSPEMIDQTYSHEVTETESRIADDLAKRRRRRS